LVWFWCVFGFVFSLLFEGTFTNYVDAEVTISYLINALRMYGVDGTATVRQQQQERHGGGQAAKKKKKEKKKADVFVCFHESDERFAAAVSQYLAQVTGN
jgi:hypothetical protein